MKKVLFLAICFLSAYHLKAQVLNPVAWTATSKKVKNNTFEVHLIAKLEKGWHIYSQNTPDGGPVPTSISMSINPLFAVDGKWKEIGKLEQHHEKLFGVDVKQYSDNIDFVQLLKVKAPVKTSAAIAVEYMVCNDKQCLPPITKKLSVSLN